MRSARFEGARDLGIERGHRHRDADEIVARHVGEQIDIAQNAVRLGGNDQRVARFGKDFDD